MGSKPRAEDEICLLFWSEALLSLSIVTELAAPLEHSPAVKVPCSRAL